MASEKWTEKQIRELLPVIRHGITRVVRNPDDVPDLVQETLLKLLKAAANEQLEEVSLNAYAWAAARNTAVDFLRHQLRLGGHFLPLDTVASGLDEDFDGHRAIVASVPVETDPLLFEIISRALQELSSNHRQVLILHAQGYSYEEMAQIQDVGVGTVRSRLHHARRNARKLLQPLIEDV
jgi:RNA polymerase sigma-70 factor, ECF subfamily